MFSVSKFSVTSGYTSELPEVLRPHRLLSYFFSYETSSFTFRTYFFGPPGIGHGKSCNRPQCCSHGGIAPSGLLWDVLPPETDLAEPPRPSPGLNMLAFLRDSAAALWYHEGQQDDPGASRTAPEKERRKPEGSAQGRLGQIADSVGLTDPAREPDRSRVLPARDPANPPGQRVKAPAQDTSLVSASSMSPLQVTGRQDGTGLADLVCPRLGRGLLDGVQVSVCSWPGCLDPLPQPFATASG
ncbi:hypothetical protein CB1_000327028 [Camelus ferus]|nr:hypothetical protein CB1_000327028 [Camelus ferus]